MQKHIIRTIPIICLLILALLSTIQNIKPAYTDLDLTTPANTPHNIETKPVSKNTETTILETSIPPSEPAINNTPATESTEPSKNNVETTIQETAVETTAGEEYISEEIIASDETPNENLYVGANIIGYLTISAIDIIKEPIVLGFSQDTVDRYPITMNEKPERKLGGEMLTQICGHNTGIFGNIQNAKINDAISIETVDGYVFNYKVSYSRIITNQEDELCWYGFTDVNTGEWVLKWDEESNDLCMFTCANNLPLQYRYYVRDTCL